MKTERVIYRDGEAQLHGYIAAADFDTPRPAVLIAHAWAGLTDFEQNKAHKMADLGYVGFALDNYGNGKTGSGTEENSRLMKPFVDDRALLQRRLLAGLEAARGHPAIDATRVAAIGFCFGGLCVLDLARAGAELRGVVSFHGLFFPSGLDAKDIKAKVLAMHGWDDPMVPPELVVALATELTEARADWQIHAYGGTVHAFTNPDANDTKMGTVYSERASRRAWETAERFLAESLE